MSCGLIGSSHSVSQSVLDVYNPLSLYCTVLYRCIQYEALLIDLFLSSRDLPQTQVHDQTRLRKNELEHVC